MKKLTALLLAALMLLTLSGCVPSLSKMREELFSQAPSEMPSPSPSPSPDPTVDPAMILSDEEIDAMIERAGAAAITQADIEYFLNGAYPILADTEALAELLQQVDTDSITPENSAEWKPLLQQVSEKSKDLCTRFESLTPTENFADFQKLMVLGYRCFGISMDLLIESEGEDLGKMLLAVDYMLKGNTYIQGANDIMTNMNVE